MLGWGLGASQKSDKGLMFWKGNRAVPFPLRVLSSRAFGCLWPQVTSVSHPKLPRTEQFEKLVAAAPCRVRNHWDLKTPPATVAPLGNPRSSLSLTGRSSIAAGGCGVTEVSGVGACGGLSILSSSELSEGLLRVWFAG